LTAAQRGLLRFLYWFLSIRGESAANC